MKTIDIIISADGNVAADLEGFKGQGCDSVITQLLNSVGAAAKKTKKKEYFQTEKQTVKA